MTQPVAPSLSPAEFPAVTRPCARNGVFSPASATSNHASSHGMAAEVGDQPVARAGLSRHVDRDGEQPFAAGDEQRA